MKSKHNLFFFTIIFCFSRNLVNLVSELSQLLLFNLQKQVLVRINVHSILDLQEVEMLNDRLLVAVVDFTFLLHSEKLQNHFMHVNDVVLGELLGISTAFGRIIVLDLVKAEIYHQAG